MLADFNFNAGLNSRFATRLVLYFYRTLNVSREIQKISNSNFVDVFNSIT